MFVGRATCQLKTKVSSVQFEDLAGFEYFYFMINKQGLLQGVLGENMLFFAIAKVKQLIRLVS